MATVNAPQRVQSVTRAAELLKALGAGGGEATVFDLADRCGLNRSTAWRILATLEESGLVERDQRARRVRGGYAPRAPPPPGGPAAPGAPGGRRGPPAGPPPPCAGAGRGGVRRAREPRGTAPPPARLRRP